MADIYKEVKNVFIQGDSNAFSYRFLCEITVDELDTWLQANFPESDWGFTGSDPANPVIVTGAGADARNPSAQSLPHPKWVKTNGRAFDWEAYESLSGAGWNSTSYIPSQRNIAEQLHLSKWNITSSMQILRYCKKHEVQQVVDGVR